jgi:hypothetical protein
MAAHERTAYSFILKQPTGHYIETSDTFMADRPFILTTLLSSSANWYKEATLAV